MDASLLIRGVVVGFAVAAALGPIGLLVIRRTIDRGFGYGWVSGLGVACADASYAAVAAFGLTAVRELLVGADRWLGIGGGVVLLVVAARALTRLRRPRPTPEREPIAAPTLDDPAGLPMAPRWLALPPGAPGAWLSMVGLTLANPATILSFAALFAGLGAGTGGPAGAALVTLGVFVGSVSWWAILVGVVAGLRARLGPPTIRRLNLASAVLIGVLGAVAIGLGLGGG